MTGFIDGHKRREGTDIGRDQVARPMRGLGLAGVGRGKVKRTAIGSELSPRPADLAGLVHHSDRGVQYLAIRYTERLAHEGAVTSVGSKGDSDDNARRLRGGRAAGRPGGRPARVRRRPAGTPALSALRSPGDP